MTEGRGGAPGAWQPGYSVRRLGQGEELGNQSVLIIPHLKEREAFHRLVRMESTDDFLFIESLQNLDPPGSHPHHILQDSDAAVTRDGKCRTFNYCPKIP